MYGEHSHGRDLPNDREQRVIELVAQGFTNGDVARALGTTQPVVKNQLQAIYDKLGLWNRVELALWHEARKHEGTLPAVVPVTPAERA